jgi:hypothetical protein
LTTYSKSFCIISDERISVGAIELFSWTGEQPKLEDGDPIIRKIDETTTAVPDFFKFLIEDDMTLTSCAG